MILPKHGQVRRVAEQLLRPAVAEPEPGHHLVVDEQRAVFLSQSPEGPAELGRRGHEAHVADDRFEDHAGDPVALRREQLRERLRVVVPQHAACPAVQPTGTPGLLGTPSVSALEPADDEQRIDVAVVAAGELDDQVAAGEPAREPDGAHRRLGAAGDEPHHLDRRHRVDDHFGELAFRVRTARRSWSRCLTAASDGFDHARVAVAEDHRPPRADEVEVAVAVEVEEVRAVGAGDEQRAAADRRRTRGPGCSPRRGSPAWPARTPRRSSPGREGSSTC